MSHTARTIPSKTEVNLRRLLWVCETQVSNEDGIIRGHEKLKFITNINHLKKLLEQIERETSDQVDKTAVSEYARKIQRLSDIVNEFKLTSPVNRTFSQARFTKNAYQTQLEKNKENELELKLVRQAEKELKLELLQPPHALTAEPEPITQTIQEKRMELFSSGNTESELRQRSSTKFDHEETSNIESVLQYHRKTQEELTKDLLRMSERLKMNSVAFGDILARDEKIFDEAQSVLTTNLDRLKKEGMRLDRYGAQSGKTTWLVWLVVVFVCIISPLMYILIRVLPKG